MSEIKRRGGNLRNSRTTHPNKKIRQENADKRQALRDKRSPLEQIVVLNIRLGAGTGAIKERLKLAKQIKSESTIALAT